MIAECHPKCKVYQDLPEFRYIVAPLDKVKEIDNKIKKKIEESDKKLSTQSVFLFSQTKLLNRGNGEDMQKLRLKSSTTSIKTSRMRCCTCTSPTWNPSDF